MPEIETRLKNQIERAENRYRRSTIKRDQLHQEMQKVARGGEPDWRSLDQKARYARRLERLGLLKDAEAVIDEEVSGFNPLERILGASQLTGIAFIEQAIIAARSVARIEIRGPGGRLSGYGSGVLVSPRLLMTNNHVLGGKSEAASSVAQFEHLTSAGGIAMDARSFRFRPDEFFVTEAALDFTLVAVEPVNANGDRSNTRGWCPLIRGSGKAVLGERVNIIQHPGGERMQVTVRDNTIVAVIDDFLQYEADTRPGSSGSPVFNEQWELAALHHAGVPERDNRGRILLQDGTPWTGRREDLDKISWIANEGTRISRIVKHVEERTLSAAERILWQEAFIPPPMPNLWDLFRGDVRAGGSETSAAPSAPAPGVTEGDGSASWLFRLSFGPVGSPGPGPQPGLLTVPSPSAPDPVVGDDGTDDHGPGAGPGGQSIPDDPAARLAEQVFERFHHEGPYYDADADETARDAYWEGFDFEAAPDTLAGALQHHLERTHEGRHGYSTARHKYLYPAIDLREDGSLQNVYSGVTLDPREVIASELAEVLPRAEALGFEAESLDLDRLLANDALWEAVEEETLGQETASAFNCEHVVCQSWFDKRQPMKADLHHLFTCEPGCNSFRSNIPYWSFGPEDEAERDFCGRREGNRFEPEFGHGPVARATMYFLMRYPGEVGDRRTELTRSRVNVLMNWHEMDPPGRYELHRNWLTEKAQGNRNPFVDFPGLASTALLTLGFGRR
jgi:endonuclease G